MLFGLHTSSDISSWSSAVAKSTTFAGKKLRPWAHTAPGFDIHGYAFGPGDFAFEVLVATATGTEAKSTAIRGLWKARLNSRAIPLLLVVHRPDGLVQIAGPMGLKDDAPVFGPLELPLVEQVCKEALEQPEKEAALRYLRDALPAVQSETPGLRNEGFLAGYTIARLPTTMDIWPQLTARAQQLIGQEDTALLRGLGFELSPLDNLTSLLKASANGSRTAVAIVLQPDESPDLDAVRFNGISPVTYAMGKATQEKLRFVIVCQGPRVRLYSAEPQAGVASRSRGETFVELHTGLLTGNRAGYLLALLSAEALADGGYFDQALYSSKHYAAEVAKRLRERVYDHVVPELAMGLAAARKISKPTAEDLKDTYTMAMTTLFRLLFVAYAEDKKLLPYGLNGLYDKRSLKEKAKEVK